MEDEKKEQKVTEPIEEGKAKDFCDDPKAMAGLFEKVNELKEKGEEGEEKGAGSKEEPEEDFFAN
jgi:hypothetical protein